MLLKNLVTLYKYRYLLTMWTLRDIKIRYKQSLLGAAWAMLQPISLMVIFTIVFSYFVHIPTDGIPYPIFAFTALLPWSFFSTAISFGVPSLVSNMNLLTKIYFPREILPLASIFAALVDYGVGFLAYVVLLAVYSIPLTINLIWLPLILLIQLFLTVGVTFAIAASNVFYRDIRFLVPVLMQLWLYATPVIYSMSSVPAWIRPIYTLNPMAGIIDSYRRVMLLNQSPSPLDLGVAAIIAVSLMLLAYIYFKNAEWRFADVI